MIRLSLILVGIASASSAALGCGLDWTLPASHFENVDEEGYLEYWQKIGQVYLGDRLVIPINVSFNSRQESISPTLGKGWIVALLESHVEPIDENSMKVVMPDGWTFTFLRNGSTDTWRGNAGWVGETSNTIFTITAPCGWRIRFDSGKIQEIDSNDNRVLTYKYSGAAATEIDVDGKAFLQVESDDAGDNKYLLIGGERVDIALAPRPRIQSRGNQRLITGLDASVSQLKWQDGTSEYFKYGVDDKLNNTLIVISPDKTTQQFVWSPDSKQIISDKSWHYFFGEAPYSQFSIKRTNSLGQTQIWDDDPAIGRRTSIDIDGTKTIEYRFVSGPFFGKIRKYDVIRNGTLSTLYSADYDEKGRIVRMFDRGQQYVFSY